MKLYIADDKTTPHSSYVKLAPYFQDDAKSLQAKLVPVLLPLLQQAILVIFSLKDYKGFPARHMSFDKVHYFLQLERTNKQVATAEVDPDKSAWDVDEWQLFFVYSAVDKLFAKPTAPYQHLQLDVKGRDDRAFFAFLRLLREYKSALMPNVKAQTPQDGQPMKAAIPSATNQDILPISKSSKSRSGNETTKEATGPATPALHKPASKEPPNVFTGKPKIRMKTVPKPASGKPAQSARKTAVQHTSSQQPDTEHHEEPTLYDTSNNTDTDTSFVTQMPKQARLLRDLVGDDVYENPIRKSFLRLNDGPGARLIGSDHLIGVDPTQTVDWVDDDAIDYMNASPDLLRFHDMQSLQDRGVSPVANQDQSTLDLVNGDPTTLIHEERFELLRILTQYQPIQMDKVMETAEPIEGLSLVGEETGRELVDELDTPPSTKQSGMKSGTDAFAAIDLNDDDFLKRQRELMNIFVAEQTTAEQLAQAMTDLHIS
jgi:hypothetical protein